MEALATPDDCELAETIAKADTQVQAMLRERNITRLDLVACDPWSGEFRSSCSWRLSPLPDQFSSFMTVMDEVKASLIQPGTQRKRLASFPLAKLSIELPRLSLRSFSPKHVHAKLLRKLGLAVNDAPTGLKRVIQLFMYLRNTPDDNHYAHPIDFTPGC